MKNNCLDRVGLSKGSDLDASIAFLARGDSDPSEENKIHPRGMFALQ